MFQFQTNLMVAILDFANMAVPGGAPIGAHEIFKEYWLDHLWANFGDFGRICTKNSIRALTAMGHVGL